jgi:hypothetical protein
VSDGKSPRAGTRDELPSYLRWAWLAVAGLFLVILSIGAPARLRQMRTICIGDDCAPPRLTPDVARDLQDMGVSVDFYAAYVTGFEATLAFVSAVVGLLILRQKPDDRFAVFVAVVFAVGLPCIWLSDGLGAVQLEQPIIADYWRSFGFGAFLLLGYLFPNGRFVPRWSWMFAVALAIWVPIWPLTPLALLSPAWVTVVVGLASTIAIAQVYRYLWVSNQVERQQTKWVMVGFVVALLSVIFGLLLPPLLFPDSISPLNALPDGTPDLLYRLFLVPLVGFAPPLLVPAMTIGLAVLRYGLWEVDPLLNRALVYGSLTIALTAVYLGLVAGLSSLVGAMTTGTVTEDQPALALALSTLTVVALFRPLRARIQRLIDRRFYRSRYDAARTIADFNARLRDNVDLDALQVELRATVEEAMQPTHVSFWVRSDTDP